MSAERAGPHDLTWRRFGRLVALSLGSVRRRTRLFALAVAGTLALAIGGLALTPPTYEVRVRLVVRPSGALASRFDEWKDAPVRTAVRLLRSRARLEAIARRADLPRAWAAGRSPLGRLREALGARLGARPLDDEELLDLTTGLLERRLAASVSKDGSVEIAVQWPDRAVAVRLAELAQSELVGTWRALEVASIGDLIVLLESHAVAAKGDVERRLAALERRGGPGPAEDAGAGLEGGGRDEEGRALADLAVSASRRGRGKDRGRSRPGSGPDADMRLHFEMLRIGMPLVPADADEEEGGGGERGAGGGAEGAAARLARQVLASDPSSGGTPAGAESARAELDDAVDRYAVLLDRIEAARLELATSSAAFGGRYMVVLPPEPPRDPVRPTAALVVLAALADGLLLGLFATTLAELRRSAAPGAAVREGVVP